MATTANGTPYVESSDLVANYPAVSLALAEHIDDFTGKVLQVVRGTDVTTRTTTSTSFVDASISVTITPQRNTSAVLLIWSALFLTPVSQSGKVQITDSSNVAISGAESMSVTNLNASFQTFEVVTIFGYATPATTSAVTYKGRFGGDGGNSKSISNAINTGQLYAIEVSA